MFTSYVQTVLKRCDELALISQSPEYIDRRYLTNEHKLANQLVASWMEQANMQTWQDEAGNQWGCYKSPYPDAETLIIGSHLDTVPNSGKYDGILGVLLPLGLVQWFADNSITLPFNLEIVGFADEEGTRFGTTLLGSRAVAGTWQDRWASLLDKDGLTVATALRDFGLNINNIHNASRAQSNLLGFVEVHIEQGPVLESQNLPVGIVSGIAGAKRYKIEIEGHAGHAGTVPMALRQDAIAGAAEMILAIEQAAIEHEVVATVGQIQSLTNAVNVISGKVDISLDVRSLDNSKRDLCIEQIKQKVEYIAQIRGLTVTEHLTHEADATLCHPDIMSQLESACAMNRIKPFVLSSGAGHDAMAMAELCPTGMLFVRCAKGISHNPAESVNFEDVNDTLLVLKSYVDQLAKQYGESSELVA
ncbi:MULTISPECIES: allantoate amidohydrolase [Alteromonadaceae]|uniref:allantoate amidohydrolase n=1 Tax=Alteromonadaceae TaxID=72275 RepID=UPI001C083F6D|nr:MULTISPECIES: allantoate amidohydrolase [Aliiglaciecola]MBU2876370.1 allantoate amidohydrolase [Aliiglaciecola lipolytica]MDO6710586.1 allantoate amidohydrolase [Aliiglaciecola sp. 2_MG-2023]MDO6751549.1 allantoate amidohydrolase [Aliiglaciecola sp. 1_MG-2023]